MTPPGSWVVLRVMDMFLNYIVAMGWWFYDTRKVPNATELDFEMADLILCEMHPILLLFFFFFPKKGLACSIQGSCLSPVRQALPSDSSLARPRHLPGHPVPSLLFLFPASPLKPPLTPRNPPTPVGSHFRGH